jgi:glutamate dehydrogenase/leucine dehydrogenase
LGWDEPRTLAKIDAIYETLLQIFWAAEQTNVATSKAADLLAEQQISSAVAH